jgi:undecaprenyl diphosphate synthase
MEHAAPIDIEHLPRHVGIIMDGNGRWATARGLKRTDGHREGLKAAKRVVRRASELGIPYVSLYTFSTENWNRTPDEVKFLMSLVNLAMNYGGRDEILRAFARLSASEDYVPGRKPDLDLLARYLDRPEFPDVDLVIRTGGERRISNFLLWEIAYAELWFSAKLWPDWGGEDLVEALRDFQSRKRNFGGVR